MNFRPDGFYTDIDDTEYFAIPAMGRSQLAILAKGLTPAHAYDDWTHGKEKTSAMEVGTASHMALFQPERFSQQVVIGPTKTRDTKAWVALQEAQPDTLILTEKEHYDASNCSASAHRKLEEMGLCMYGPHAAQGIVESVGLYTHMDSVRLKIKTDYYDPAEGILYDYKTSSIPVSDDGFTRSIWDRDYHVQAAVYTWVMQRLGRTVNGFRFIATEKFAPFLTAVYEIHPNVIHDTLDMLMPHLDTLVECTDEGAWPGYANNITLIGLPRWARLKTSSADQISEAA